MIGQESMCENVKDKVCCRRIGLERVGSIKKKCMTSCPGRNNEAQQKGVIKSFAKPVLSVLVWCFCNCVHPHDRLHVTKAFLSHRALL